MSRVRGATRIVTVPPAIGTATTRTVYALAWKEPSTSTPRAADAAASAPTLSHATSNGAEPKLAMGRPASHDASATGYPDEARSENTYRSSSACDVRGRLSPE